MSRTPTIFMASVVARVLPAALVCALVAPATAQPATIGTAELCSGTVLSPHDGYFEAVPRDELLIPVTAGADPEDVVATFPFQVTGDRAIILPGTSTYLGVVPGGNGYSLIRWVPDEPMTPGPHVGHLAPRYETRGADGQLYCERPGEAFSFTVAEETRKDWVEEADLTLRLAPGRGGRTTSVACCEVRNPDCESDGNCIQCWDAWSQPELYVEWVGTGIAYLEKRTEAKTENLTLRLSAPTSDIYTLTALGEYCIEGTVGASNAEPRSIGMCGTAADENDVFDETPSAREQCRTLVAAASCVSLPEELPPGMSDLSRLYVVRGISEGEARAALQAAPYDSLLGCYTLNPDGTIDTNGSTPDAGTSSPSSGAGGSSGADSDATGGQTSAAPEVDASAGAPSDAGNASASSVSPPFTSNDSSCIFSPPTGSRPLWPALAALLGLTLLTRRRQRRASSRHQDP